jgi:LacI family transcriptional regulator
MLVDRDKTGGLITENSSLFVKKIDFPQTNGHHFEKPPFSVFISPFLAYNTVMKEMPKVALMIESSRTYGRELVRRIMRYSQVHGHWVFPWIFYRQDFFHVARGNEQAELDNLRKWSPDGIIARDSKDFEELASWDISMFAAVAMWPPRSNRNNIVTDNQAIGQMAAEHLLERGFRHFGYCGFDDMYWSVQRGKSFKERISEAGFETRFYKQPKTHSSRVWYKEEKILAEWLKGLPKPAGVMACNDDRGQHITEACAIAKIEVPYEVAIIGVDNDDQVCDISHPPLSSVALDVEKAGFRAAELLDKMMAGKKMPPQTVVVNPGRVVTRQSTSFVAAEDKTVSQALNFIHQNAKHLIQVDDVIKAINVSRRSLHDKFIKALGHSVYDEIKRVRIDLISQMLVETDLSVSEIAFSLGYDSANHIARYFQQKMRISPLDYRKLHRRR